MIALPLALLFAVPSEAASPFYSAAASLDNDHVRAFARRGADLNAADPALFGWTALHWLLYNKEAGPTAALLLELGADPAKPDARGDSPVHSTAGSGNAAVLTALLKGGADPNRTNTEGLTPLHVASNAGGLDAVSALLAHRADPDAKAGTRTPLVMALSRGHVAVAKKLLEAGAKAEGTDDSGWTPLHSAVQQKSAELAKILLDRGADVNARSADGDTPLHLAARANDPACAKLLLERGAKTDIQNKKNDTPLYEASDGGRTAAALVLLAHKADPNDSRSGYPPIHNAVGRNNVSLLKAMLAQGAKLDLKNKEGKTALDYGYQHGSEELRKALLASLGARPRSNDGFGWQPLVAAVEAGDAEAVRLLLEGGADPDHAQCQRCSLLFCAVERGKDPVVSLLLKHGADPNRVNPSDHEVCRKPPLFPALERSDITLLSTLLGQGAKPDPAPGVDYTPLSEAIYKGNVKAAELLLKHGADVNRLRSNGTTPLLAAVERGNPEMVRLLLDHGAQPDLTKAHDAPLYLAVREPKKAPIVELLLKKGADPNLANEYGDTPLYHAVKEDNAEVAQMLLKAGADPKKATRLGGTPVSAASYKPAMKALIEEYLPAAASAAPSASGGIGKAELQRIIEQAVANAQPKPQPQAHAPAPAKSSEPSSDVDKPSYAGAKRPNDFALVVAVERYPTLPKATWAERDAAAVRKHLIALGFPERNVVSLTGERATKGTMAARLGWLAKNISADSTVFFYYSGHGAPDPKSGGAYLVPFDGDPMFLSDTAYPVKSLYQDLAKLKAKRTIVALDACFSGSGGRSVLAEGARPLVTRVETPPAAGLTILSAAAGDEITGAFDRQGHGIFTYYLLKGLNSGKRSAGELFDYLKPQVQDEARRQNRDQTPALQGDRSAAL